MFSYTIKVHKVKQPTGKIVAFAVLTIDDVLEVHGFRIINGTNGLFVGPPNHLGKTKNENGEIEERYFDDVRFVGDNYEEIAKEIKEAIISAYINVSSGQERSEAANAQVQVNTSIPNPSSERKKPLW